MRARLALVAAIGALVCLLAASGALADAAFEDPQADQVNTLDLVAPDITAVQVSNTRNGLITIRVTIGNYETLPPHSAIVLLFDLDRNLATGDQGFENAVTFQVDPVGQALRFERWDESTFRLFEISAASLTSTFSGGVYTLTIPRSELANTARFAFGLYAAAFDPDGSDDPAVDSAPNTELWSYDLAGLPAPRLTTQRLVVRPGRPAAGRAFVVQTAVRRADTGDAVTAGSVTCAARVAGARVGARGGFSGGLARCVVSVPQNARGKTLKGTLTVRAVGARLTRTFSYRVG